MTRDSTEKQWTILSLITWSENYLKEKGIESPRLTSELLLAGTLSCDRVYLYTHFDQPLTKEELERYKSGFLRRVNREPIQYILNRSEFYGRSFYVDTRVLIPRPETEHLIEAVIGQLKESPKRHHMVLDIGTGSGIIAITLTLEYSEISVTAIDNSKDALEVAAINANRYGIRERIRFIGIDVMDENLSLEPKSYDILVSNPPYIAAADWRQLPDEIRFFEPAKALTDRGDGYTYYRRIASLANSLLRENGAVIVEVGFGQSEEVETIFRNRGAKSIQKQKDYAGIVRVLGGKW
jgi:release factor glutamine methyltransferase